MDYGLTPELEQFRKEVREFVETHKPDVPVKAGVRSADDAEELAALKEWTRKLFEAGYIGADWPARLRAAGFTVLESRELVVDLAAPLPAPAVRYAVATLRRFRAGIADRLSAEDRETLDALLDRDGHALRNHPALSVHSTRSAWIATPA